MLQVWVGGGAAGLRPYGPALHPRQCDDQLPHRRQVRQACSLLQPASSQSTLRFLQVFGKRLNAICHSMDVFEALLEPFCESKLVVACKAGHAGLHLSSTFWGEGLNGGHTSSAGAVRGRQGCIQAMVCLWQVVCLTTLICARLTTSCINSKNTRFRPPTKSKQPSCKFEPPRVMVIALASITYASQ
jgi:hypothetical protein